jgi:type I restriction enzyme S subunit
MLDVSEKNISIIKDVFRRLVPACEVRAYGSRVNGASHVGSDLDIVVIGKEPLDWKVMAKLRGEFEESNLPFSVDVLDWNTLPENFKDTITRNFEVVQDSGFDTVTGSAHSTTA